MDCAFVSHGGNSTIVSIFCQWKNCGKSNAHPGFCPANSESGLEGRAAKLCEERNPCSQPTEEYLQLREERNMPLLTELESAPILSLHRFRA